MKADITKMLTLSTAHISEETSEILASPEELEQNTMISIYDKDCYGWIIPITEHIMKGSMENTSNENQSENKEIPADLYRLCCLAYDMDCQWLCLDRDGNTLPYLPTYDW